MFDWVPVARYEELWWLIGLGTLFKFILPYALLAELVRSTSAGSSLPWAYRVLALKLLALSVFAAFYATSHALLSNGAPEILAELSLLIAVSALPWPMRGWRRLVARLGRAPHDIGMPISSELMP